MNKRRIVSSLISFLSVIILFSSFGCITKDYNLRAIRDSRTYVDEDSTANQMSWYTESWSTEHSPKWASSSVIITGVGNILGGEERIEWIREIEESGFDGLLLIEWNLDYLPISWGTEEYGTVERTYYNRIIANESSTLLSDYPGDEIKISTNGNYVLDPTTFLSIWKDDLLLVLDSYITKLKSELEDSTNIKVGVFLPTYNYRSFYPCAQDESIQDNIDPFGIGKAYDDYTAGELDSFNLYYDRIIRQLSSNGYIVVTEGDRLTVENDIENSLMATEEIDGHFFSRVNLANVDSVIAICTEYRTAKVPSDTSSSLLLIAGIMNNEYNMAGGAAIYGQLIDKVIAAGMYFTPGGSESYFEYPEVGLGSWWLRVDDDSKWQDDPNNPTYASISEHPMKIYNVTITPVEPGGGEDTTPPVLANTDIDVNLIQNGESLTLVPYGETNEPCTFVLEATYSSSYPKYTSGTDSYHAWKTIANGDYADSTRFPYISVFDLSLEIGPRTYHSDTLVVSLTAVDTAGNRITEELYSNTIEMPFGTPSDDTVSDGYAVATNFSGNIYPSDWPYVTIEKWSRPDLILCTEGFLFESSGTPSAYEHWVDKLRNYSGSNNKAVVGFSEGFISTATSAFPVRTRYRQFLNNLIAIDEDVVVRNVAGNVPAYTEIINSTYANAYVLNTLSELARDSTAWFITQEWNHSENRRPKVGLMFDVYEIHTDYGLYNGSAIDYFGDVADLDQDGTVMIDDDDEYAAFRLGKIDFLKSLRRHIKESATNTDVGKYFLIGANSISAKSDSAFASQLDFLFLEDFECPPYSGTGYTVYYGTPYYDHEYNYPYFLASAADFVRTYPSDIYYYNAALMGEGGVIPNISSAWEDFSSYMRPHAGGPYISPESGDRSVESVHATYIEALSLLFDGFYPIWLKHDDPYNWYRQWWHPSQESYVDLHGLGSALAECVRDTIENNYVYISRQYENGLVEVAVPDSSVTSCEDGDLFEFRVTMNDVVVRESDNWDLIEMDSTPPTILAFNLSEWDAQGVSGSIRIHVTASSNDATSTWRIRYGKSFFGPWTYKNITDTGTTVDEWVDTELAPFEGTVYAAIYAKDSNLNESSPTADTIAVEAGATISTFTITAPDTSTGTLRVNVYALCNKASATWNIQKCKDGVSWVDDSLVGSGTTINEVVDTDYEPFTGTLYMRIRANTPYYTGSWRQNTLSVTRKADNVAPIISEFTMTYSDSLGINDQVRVNVAATSDDATSTWEFESSLLLNAGPWIDGTEITTIGTEIDEVVDTQRTPTNGKLYGRVFATDWNLNKSEAKIDSITIVRHDPVPVITLFDMAAYDSTGGVYRVLIHTTSTENSTYEVDYGSLLNQLTEHSVLSNSGSDVWNILTTNLEPYNGKIYVSLVAKNGIYESEAVVDSLTVARQTPLPDVDSIFISVGDTTSTVIINISGVYNSAVEEVYYGYRLDSNSYPAQGSAGTDSALTYGDPEAVFLLNTGLTTEQASGHEIWVRLRGRNILNQLTPYVADSLIFNRQQSSDATPAELEIASFSADSSGTDSGGGETVRLIGAINSNELAKIKAWFKSPASGSKQDSVSMDTLGTTLNVVLETGLITSEAASDSFYLITSSVDENDNVSTPEVSSMQFVRQASGPPVEETVLYVLTSTSGGYTVNSGTLTVDDMEFTADRVSEMLNIRIDPVDGRIKSDTPLAAGTLDYIAMINSNLPMIRGTAETYGLLFFDVHNALADSSITDVLEAHLLVANSNQSVGLAAGDTIYACALKNSNFVDWNLYPLSNQHADVSYDYYDVSQMYTWADSLGTFTKYNWESTHGVKSTTNITTSTTQNIRDSMSWAEADLEVFENWINGTAPEGGFLICAKDISIWRMATFNRATGYPILVLKVNKTR